MVANIRFALLSFTVLFLINCQSNEAEIAETNESTEEVVSEDKLVLQVNFNNYSEDYNNYSIALANIDFGGIEHVATESIRGLVDGINEWPQKTKVGKGNLRAHFPALMATGRKTGFIFDKGIPASKKVVLEYKVKFSPDFQWKFGGKLPGLGGGKVPVGCTEDEDLISNGFSARLMWLANGRLVLYSYFPDKSSRCGTVTTIMEEMETDRWYTIKQELGLNNPGVYNGSVVIYVDDKLKLTRRNVLFREFEKENVEIDRVVFHTYAGGSDTADWWSTKDQYIYFDDFKVWIKA